MDGDLSITGMSIGRLELSARTRNCILAAGCVTVGDLVRLGEGDLMRLPGFGIKCLREIRQQLGAHGYGLTGPPMQISWERGERPRSALQVVHARLLSIEAKLDRIMEMLNAPKSD